MKKTTGQGQGKKGGILETILEKERPPAPAPAGEPSPFEPVAARDEGDAPAKAAARQQLMRGIHLNVRVELGRRQLLLREALALAPGSVVDLEKLADEPVELYVGDVLVARGEVILVNESFCVRLSEVLPAAGIEP